MCQILNESKESLDVVIVTGLPPIPDLLHLIHACVDTCNGYDVAKTVHPLRIEVNFVSTEVQLCFAQLVKHQLQVFFMLFDGQRVNEYII